MNHRSAPELKAIARDKLLGNYSTVIGAIVAVQLIFVGVNYIARSVNDLNSITGVIIYSAATLIMGLIASVFTVGKLTIYLKISCGDKVKITDVFSEFKGHPDKVILLDFFFTLRCIMWLLPAALAYVAVFMLGYEGDIYMLIFVVLSVLGLAAMIYTYVRLSMCFFIYLDYPDHSVKEIMDKSIVMMNGHMGQFIYMAVSFIPICLLGILSLGIGFIFIEPYVSMSYTQFYLGIASAPMERGTKIDITVG